MKYLLTVAVIFLSSVAFTAPTLSPNSGTLSASQTLTYAANGTAVQDFWIYIGSNVGGRDIADTGNLGSADGTYTATLPAGKTVHLRLWYRVSGAWQRDDYSVSVPSATVGTELLDELACGIGQLIKSTVAGWECVDSAVLGGAGSIVTSGLNGKQIGSLSLREAAILGAVSDDDSYGQCQGAVYTIVDLSDIGFKDLVKFDENYICSNNVNSISLVYLTDDCSGVAYQRRRLGRTSSVLSNLLALNNPGNFGFTFDSSGSTYSVYRFFPESMVLVSDVSSSTFSNGNHIASEIRSDNVCYQIAVGANDALFQSPELVLNEAIPAGPYTAQLLY